MRVRVRWWVRVRVPLYSISRAAQDPTAQKQVGSRPESAAPTGQFRVGVRIRPPKNRPDPGRSQPLRPVNLRPPACTPPPFHCLGKHSLCNIISFSSTFKIQEILFSLQTCTFLKKRRFSEDVVFQKSTSRLHGSTRFRIRRLPEATHDKPTTYRSLRSPCSWLHTGAWPS